MVIQLFSSIQVNIIIFTTTEKADRRFVDYRRQRYDYKSVMHYEPYQGAVAWG